MLNFLTQPGFSRYLIAGIFFTAGLLHLFKPESFTGIMPDYIRYHLAMVYISGFAEILGAIGILYPPTQVPAAWGLILLLAAVFPANIDMAVKAVQAKGYISWYSIATLLRLPLQFVLMYWIYWTCLR